MAEMKESSLKITSLRVRAEITLLRIAIIKRVVCSLKAGEILLISVFSGSRFAQW